jgi:hypothetical protein
MTAVGVITLCVDTALGTAGQLLGACAHGVNALGGGRTPGATSPTVLWILGEIDARSAALHGVLQGALALSIQTLLPAPAAVPTATAVLVVVEDVLAAVTAAHAVEGADAAVALTAEPMRAAFSAVTAVVVVVLERDALACSRRLGCGRVFAEDQAVGADALALGADSWLGTGFAAGSAMIGIHLDVHASSVTILLAREADADGVLAELGVVAGVGAGAAPGAIIVQCDTFI